MHAVTAVDGQTRQSPPASEDLRCISMLSLILNPRGSMLNPQYLNPRY